MANFAPSSFVNIPTTNLDEWQPQYPGWRSVRDFANRAHRVTTFDARQGRPVEHEQRGDNYVTIGQRAIEDTAKQIAERGLVNAEGEGGVFNVLDYGISAPFADQIKTFEVPPFPWETKLEFTPGEIKQGLDRLTSMLPTGGFPVRFGEQNQPVFKPEDMADWSVRAAESFANSALGQKLPKEVSDALRSGAVSDTYAVLKQLPPSMHTLTEDVLDGVGQLSAVATTAFWGAVDWQGGAQGVFMTVDALNDGMVTKAEASAIGSSTGAFVGGAVGSVFGPVGTAIGSALGSLFGELLGSIFGEQEGFSQEWYDAQKSRIEQREALDQLRSEMNRIATEAQKQAFLAACARLQGAYYEALGNYMRLTAAAWATMEWETGWRFDLRWFDPNPGIDFYALYQHGAKHPNADKRCKSYTSYRDVTYKGPNYQAATAVNPARGLITERKVSVSRECHLVCPQTYGCPYPTMSGFDIPAIGQNSFYPGTGQRVANAFAARGFYWKDPANRPTCEQLYNRTELDFLYQQVTRLNAAAKLIMLDVERTAIAVQVEHDMWANGAIYKIAGLDTGVLGKIVLQKAVKDGRSTDPGVLRQPGYAGLRASYMTNKVLLYGGVGAAALALIDKVRG